jgi:hypothetical protein
MRGQSWLDLLVVVGIGLLLLFALCLVVGIGLMFWYGVPGG